MLKINRVLYAVISDIFEGLIEENKNIAVEEVRTRLNQIFDENLECVIEDFSNAASMTNLESININGSSYTRDIMIQMITEGINFTPTELRADSRSLIKHLMSNLPGEFMIYPDQDANILIEHSNVVEAQLNFVKNKILLMKGETSEPDIQVFKEVFPEILKWAQQQKSSDAASTPPIPSKKKSTPSFDTL
jgi:hypothetical protein